MKYKARSIVSAAGRYSNRHLNQPKRVLRIGNYWSWMNPDDVTTVIQTRPLLFPLRYDIELRRSFFELLCEHRSVSGSTESSLESAARGGPYYQWFEHVLVPRNAPHMINNPQMMNGLFSRRVAENVALFDSIRTRGFDTSQPITPYAGIQVGPSTEGRSINQDFYAGDGCHRLACLMALGYDELPSEFVRPKQFRRLNPLDNTLVLAKRMSIPAEWLA